MVSILNGCITVTSITLTIAEHANVMSAPKKAMMSILIRCSMIVEQNNNRKCRHARKIVCEETSDGVVHIYRCRKCGIEMEDELVENNDFIEMIEAVNVHHTQKQIADGTGYSPQYINDLINGRRLPSVSFINDLCLWMGRGPKGRLAWHRAGAKAHGWEV